MLSLPSFVLGLVFRFLSCLAPFCGVFVVLVFLPALLRYLFAWPSCASLNVVGFLCVCPLLGCCRLPFPAFCFPPPVVGPLWRPGPVSMLVPPSRYLVAFVTAWLPCFTAGSVVVLCRPHFFLSHGSKGLWLCGVCFTLHTMVHVVGLLSIPTLRYSSADGPGPPIGHR